MKVRSCDAHLGLPGRSVPAGFLGDLQAADLRSKSLHLDEFSSNVVPQRRMNSPHQVTYFFELGQSQLGIISDTQ
jgi:hypothetical protein